MTPFLASHVSPGIAIAAGVPALALIAWYWRRLALPDVPDTRRRIRRASLIVMVFTVPVLVYALGYADDRADPQRYAIMWVAAILLLLLILLLAFIDVLNNLRIQRGLRRAVERLRREGLLDTQRRQREEHQADGAAIGNDPPHDHAT